MSRELTKLKLNYFNAEPQNGGVSGENAQRFPSEIRVAPQRRIRIQKVLKLRL
jgi:hypothetical protein